MARKLFLPWEKIVGIVDKMKGIAEEDVNPISDREMLLRKEIWRLKRRKTRRMGVILTSIGLAAFLIAILLRSFPFELMSLTAFFMGFFLLYVSVERYAKEDVAARAIVSPLVALERFLKEHGATNGGVYVPPNSKFKEGRLFIPLDGNLAANGGSFDPPGMDEIHPDQLILPGEGIFIVPPGAALFEKMEEEMGEDLSKIGLDPLLRRLPLVLTEALELADGVSFDRGDSFVKFVIEGLRFNNLYNNYNNYNKHRNNLNSFNFIRRPIYSAVALALAKCTGRYVRIGRHEHDVAKDTIKLTFEFGDRAE